MECRLLTYHCCLHCTSLWSPRPFVYVKWIAGNENALEYAQGCTGREEEDLRHRTSVGLTGVILHMPLFPSTLPVAQPNSFSPALLSSSNAVLSKTLFWVLFETQSSLSCLNNLPPPRSAILSGKSQTVVYDAFPSLTQFWGELSHWPCKLKIF